VTIHTYTTKSILFVLPVDRIISHLEFRHPHANRVTNWVQFNLKTQSLPTLTVCCAQKV